MDKCGHVISPYENIAADPNTDPAINRGRELHYDALALCMQPSDWTSTTLVPTMCAGDSDNKDCIDNPVDWAATSWTTTTNYGGDVGLARDGHVIKGPYNGDGELWGCDDHDICNGAFLNDGSYAYVTTTTFPYTVGCWGPATEQHVRLPASCTLETCGANSGLAVVALTLALLAVVNTF